MRAQIEQNPTARTALFPPSPLRAEGVSEAVKMALILHQPPQHALAHYLNDRLKIAVPPPVLKNAEEPVLRSGEIDQLPGLARTDGKRFVHHDMFAGQQGLFGQLKMRGGRRGDHHQIDLAVLAHGRRVLDDFDPRVAFARGLAATFDHLGQSQAGNGRDHRRVKHPPGHAITDQPYLDHDG